MARFISETAPEQATLDWFKELEYFVLNGPDIASGELFAERTRDGDVILGGRGRSGRSVVTPWSTEELMGT